MLRKILAQIPYTLLVPFALLLGLAPFQPEPHLVEKLRLLARGQLTQAIDIFDLLMHGAPLTLLVAKAVSSLTPGTDSGKHTSREP